MGSLSRKLKRVKLRKQFDQLGYTFRKIKREQLEYENNDHENKLLGKKVGFGKFIKIIEEKVKVKNEIKINKKEWDQDKLKEEWNDE